MTYPRPTKRPLAPWTKAFPKQAKALRPEAGRAGGVKARSGSEAVRMAIYVPIANMFKKTNPWCQNCFRCPTMDVHHTKGRDGLLLFDVRHFQALCRQCHSDQHQPQ